LIAKHGGGGIAPADSTRPLQPPACLAISAEVSNDATLVTSNRRDFERVPGLRIEGWTLA
jgi:predicted nucleic acid-binding protein